MSKNTTEAKGRVIEALKNAIAETLRRSGREIPDLDNFELCPIQDIAGFDSQCGIEVTVELEAILGIADLTDNIFIKDIDSKPRARTFAETVGAILTFMGVKQ
ncbi:MAG: hypothetical protein ACRD3T_17850 [Terriglobia bacterium]